MSVIYLYSYKLPIQLSETNLGAPNFNRPMYNYNIKLYKNNHNVIDFVVRNNDRKPVTLFDATLTVVIQNSLSGQVVLEKAACVTNEREGRAQVRITASETEMWDLGAYFYNVKISRPNQGQEFLYVDLTDNVVGNFELLPPVGGQLVPSQTLDASEFTPISEDWLDRVTWFSTGAFSSANQVGVNNGTFSVAVYHDNFKGLFRAQASLQNLAPTEKSWFDVPLLVGQNQIQILPDSVSPLAFVFILNARWIRFQFKPDLDNFGSFLKVIYKIS
jgi:hypothetical protein